jgi:hypothetical protein
MTSTTIQSPARRHVTLLDLDRSETVDSATCAMLDWVGTHR